LVVNPVGIRQYFYQKALEEDRLQNLAVGGRIKLKLVLEKYFVKNMN
jgi:hypothetical protein